MRIPPPLLFVATFFAGVGMQRLLPLGIDSASLAHVARVAGFGSLAAGVLIMLASVVMFLKTRTTIIPFGKASRLVANGPFRLTRNPMYLGLVLAHAGMAGVLAEPWALILLPLPVLIVHKIVIPFEEARMLEIFGDAFRQYCARVRRWI
jgi:protein-S-isoprenylcysteine O-methyltransferase Ste14